MRFAGWLVSLAVLLASAAGAQPEIVDPTPDDDETDWALLLEDVDLAESNGPLQDAVGLVFIGSRADQEMLLLEHATGRVRHFRKSASGPIPLDELAIALDLGVDTCGERGLVGIALHPAFDRATSQTPEPPEPDGVPARDWIYLTFHADAVSGSSSDGCAGGGTTFWVVRYTWDGASLTDPVPIYQKTLAADETTQVGGALDTLFEFDADEADFLGARVYVTIGSLGHTDGPLQNDEDAGNPLDDTSVVLRLAEDGTVPGDNPFDYPDDPAPDPTPDDPADDAYFAYGIRDARTLLVETLFFDPFNARAWIAEPNAGGFDEINALLYGGNGGYSDYVGPQDETKLPKNRVNDEPNPDYKLVDLLFDSHGDPVTSYEDPAFTFESDVVHPTSLTVAGVEMGPAHLGTFFAGLEDGRLLRFRVNAARDGFLVSPPLNDDPRGPIAEIAVEDDPGTPDIDESKDADDLTQLLIAEGFGSISDVETFVDGSIFVLDRGNGTIHRVFTDAVRDVSVVSIRAPKKISLSDKKPTVRKAVQVTLANAGEVAERLEQSSPAALQQDLADLLRLTVTSPSCASPTATVVVPKYALPPYDAVIGVAPEGGRLTLSVEVEWACPGLAAGAAAQFETSVDLDMEVFGVDEVPELQADNVCPRPPAGDDPGCGARTAAKLLGGPIVTSVTRK